LDQPSVDGARWQAQRRTFAATADRLAKHGMAETESGIASKPARGTFSATFLLATLAVLESEGYEDL
jgi:hypothetical protein